MKKINTAALSGMQELLPAEQKIFNRLKANVTEIYRQQGFQAIETPVIERSEVLLAKAGGDTEKQVYFVSKARDEEADQALRFDHTVPLARYVVEHTNELSFPFRVTQIGRNYRGERAQAGRFREFYQCDVDIIGRNNLPVAYDAEPIMAVYKALMTFGLPQMLIRISNRKVLAGFLAALGLAEKMAEISNVIDHAEKVDPAVTRQDLEGLGLGEDRVDKMMALMGTRGTPDQVEQSLGAILGDMGAVAEGLSELRAVYALLAAQGLGEQVAIDLMIVRGLDYYTGTVCEIVLPEYRQIGSIAGGGRYENLASNFTDQVLPGVGMSIGLSRLFYVLRQTGLLATTMESAVDYAVLPITEHEHVYALATAERLRRTGAAVDVVLLDKKLGDKMAYASRVAKFAVVIGADEVAGGALQAKNMETGETLPLVLP